MRDTKESDISNLKVALVHDQIAEFGGAERVLISLKKAFPAAEVFTSFVDKNRLGASWQHFSNWTIIESWTSKIPFFHKLYSPLRFLLPWVWSSFDLSQYDVVIASSSWGMSKGVSMNGTKYKVQSTKKKRASADIHEPSSAEVGPVFFCYLHAPPRYLYGYDESRLRKYLPVRIYAAIVNHFLRQYDYRSSQTIDYFIFNSQEVRRRSLKFYRKDGVVIHPPIQIRHGKQSTVDSRQTANYFLTVSRLAPTKHIDLLIEAANIGKFNLKVVGTGNQEQYLKRIAGPTVEFLGAVDDQKLSDLYANARAFLYASVNEDFGMVPVEAMAHGTPAIAFASGGVLETVSDGVNGFLYRSLDGGAIRDAVYKLQSLNQEEYEELQKNAYDFAQTCQETLFIDAIRSYIATCR